MKNKPLNTSNLLLNPFKNPNKMKNRNYLSAILVVLVCGIMVTSCKDEFDEQEFLISQQDRADQLAAAEDAKEAAEKAAEEAEAAANAAALAAAGVNTAYNVYAHVDDVPVEGATVMVTNQNGTTTSATTDANGNAAFVDLEVGSYNVAVSSADHLDISYLVDFGTVEEDVHYERLSDGTIVPLPNSEASKIALFPLSGEQTATIKGTVEIETDLTNNTPEVPQNISIRANLDAAFNASHSDREDGAGPNRTIFIEGSFSFTQGDIGVATVDNTTGEYSMQVPAGTDGTTLELLIPLVEADQTLAWSMENGMDVGVQTGTQPALFGPDYAIADTSPSISGVTANFSAPPAPGRGFTPSNFTPQGRALLLTQINASINDFPNETDLQANDHIVFRGGKGSDDFQVNPIITVDAPPENPLPVMAGDTALIEAWVDWEFDTVYTIDTPGDYQLQSIVEAWLDIIDEDGIVQDSYFIGQHDTELEGSLIVGEYPLQTMANIVPTDLFTAYVVADIVIRLEPLGGVTTDATASVARDGEIRQFEIVNRGDKYTSIPGITIEGGGATTQASLEITDMAFQYEFDLDNTGNTQGYVVLPEVSYKYEDSPGNIITDDDFEVFERDVNGIPQNGFQVPILELAVRVLDGNIVFNDDDFFGPAPVAGIRLDPYSYSTPTAIVIEPEHEQAEGTLKVNSDGEISSLTVTNTGTGYTSEVDLTVDAIQGTGASFSLSGFTTNTVIGEVIWDGTHILVNKGSGYTDGVNIAEEDFSPIPSGTTVNIKNGQTKIVDINYGTGVRVNDID